MQDGIHNAQVSGVTLSNADHGCLSLWIYVDYGGAGQGFGGYNLYSKPRNSDNIRGICGWWIWRVFEVLEINNFDDIKGQTLRVKTEDGLIKAIGHFMKDKWFNPSEELDCYKLAQLEENEP